MRASSSDFSHKCSSSSPCHIASRERGTSPSTFIREPLQSYAFILDSSDIWSSSSAFKRACSYASYFSLASSEFSLKSSSSALCLASRTRWTPSSTFGCSCLFCLACFLVSSTSRTSYSAFKSACSSCSAFSLASSTMWSLSSDFSRKSSSSNFSLASSTGCASYSALIHLCFSFSSSDIRLNSMARRTPPLHLQSCALMLLYFHPCTFSDSSLLFSLQP